MDLLQSLEHTKDQLQEVMGREVPVLRHLLISLHDEHNAIIAHNQLMLDHVIEERLCIISSFEGWCAQFVTIVQQLAFEAEIPYVYTQELRHCEALEILQECLDPEDFELLFLYKQIKSLIDQIHHQNDLNAGMLKEGSFQMSRRDAHRLILASPREKPKAKIAVGVMDIE